mgnify:CR=1 FL=1
MDQAQKDELTKIRDEAQGAIAADDINKLREIVGKLEDAAQKAYASGAAGATPNGEAPKEENKPARRLRKKLPDINIQTIYGFGYRLG